MKKFTAATKQTALLAVILMGSSAWLCAQYPPDKTGQSADKSTRQDQNQKATDASASGQSQVMKANKASSLIGSTVKNQQGEKLGKIHDIVFDYSSGRVAYVVLATDTGILQAEKLHAVPLQAFQCSQDGSAVILNADKEKIARSEGFDKNSWPSLNTTAWGAEPFWKDGQRQSTPGLQGTPDTQGVQPQNGQQRQNDVNKAPVGTEPKPQPQP